MCVCGGGGGAAVTGALSPGSCPRSSIPGQAYRDIRPSVSRDKFYMGSVSLQQVCLKSALVS